MNVTAFAKWTGTLLLLLTLGACGGSGDGDGNGGGGGGSGGGGTPPVSAVIGPAGGTVIGPNGASVVVPPGALATDTTITIEQTSVGSPTLPTGVVSFGAMFAFTPHGIAFKAPVTLTIPFDPALMPAGMSPVFYKTNAANTGWAAIAGATVSGGKLSVQVTSFSGAIAGSEPPLEKVGPARRFWNVMEFTLDGAIIEPDRDADGQAGGKIDRPYDFGPATMLDPSAPVPPLLPREFRATGRIFSSAGGGSYSVSGEAPTPVVRALDRPVGNWIVLGQDQRYIKRADNAKLRLKVTQVRIEAFDSAGTDLALCGVAATDPLRFLCDGPMRAHLNFQVEVYRGSVRTTADIFFRGEGLAHLEGWRGHWSLTTPEVQNPLWSEINLDRDVDVGGDGGKHARLVLKQPVEIEVDLSAVPRDTDFTLDVLVSEFVHNRRRVEFAYLGAFFRDPTQISGDMQIITEGLEEIDPPPAPDPSATSGCASDAHPGTLTFLAPEHFIGEAVAGAGATIFVARSGGSTGEVSATVATSNGSAAAGLDYEAVNTTVVFKHGDVAPRVVQVPLIYSSEAEGDKSFNLTLSAPTGCALLGQANTTVKILDDGRVLPTSILVGGSVTGLAGSGLVLRQVTTAEALAVGNGPFTFVQRLPSGLPYNVAIETQPSSPAQVCTVTRGSGTASGADVTDIAVDCVTPPANGSLDATFGSGGKVSTAFGGDDTAMALQSDGKIVMAGGSGSDFVLARYKVDGTLDAGFGTGGLVTSDVGVGSADEARAVAIQADGKIVVAGNAVVGRTSNNQFNFDFAVARFNADGSPDLSFGSGGKVTTDFNGQTDRAFALAIQGDGKIVVAGSATPASGISTDFAVARYDGAGAPDGSFGSGGKLTTDIGGAIDIAQNIVVQPNGAILVSGVLALGSSPVLGHAGLARYDAIGNPDNSFGTAGKLTLPNLALGEALALQADGRIVIAGSAPIGGRSAFAVMRLGGNGAIELGFGSSGLATAAFSIEDDFARAVLVQADGRIVVAGQSSNRINPDFAVARFDTNGAPDASFGSAGKLTIDFFGSFDGAENVAVQPDGKLVVGGFATNGTRTGYGLTRILP
jgi:uncharacterized delta-60 repeat protein